MKIKFIEWLKLREAAEGNPNDPQGSDVAAEIQQGVKATAGQPGGPAKEVAKITGQIGRTGRLEGGKEATAVDMAAAAAANAKVKGQELPTAQTQTMKKRMKKQKKK